jgi:hypothetical protein
MIIHPAGGCAGQAVRVAGKFGPAGRRSSPARILPPQAEIATQKQGAMPVADWFDMAAPASSLQTAASGRALNLRPPRDTTEEIIVHVRRGRAAADDLEAVGPIYEAGQSDAAQRLYAAGPIWYSPEQVRLMSTAKDALGLCGGLGGLLTCPDR